MRLDHPDDHPDDPSGAVWTDEASNVSRLTPSGAIQGGRASVSQGKVVGSNRISRSTNQQVSGRCGVPAQSTPSDG
jgi:hypothetical protein